MQLGKSLVGAIGGWCVGIAALIGDSHAHRLG